MIITLLTGKTSKLREQIKNELNIDINVKRNSRAKKMTLKIDGKNQIPTLSMPTLASNKLGFNFVKNNISWIEDKLSQTVKPEKFQDNERISIFGKELTIKHCPEQKLGVQIDGDILKVSGEKGFLHRRVKDFIKKQAKDEFYKLSKAKALLVGCKLNSVVIKDTKSRWGSCSSYGNINYNWRVALAPYFVIEYLVSHEVSHLKHQDHSKEFWVCVKNLYPEYIKGKNWLKNNGKKLNIYE
ncbi:MAG: M48 family metallopeptidase [Lactobacillaceae bacterium]|jgi:predicted metal-dependent hydrolase|nr:M48 family metallopeptidase [Lactobacillaceae bacterium]